MSSEVIQSVVEILDSAHSHQFELQEVIDGIEQLEKQINSSSDVAIKALNKHFNNIRDVLMTTLDARLSSLKAEVEAIRKASLTPLEDCKSLVNDSMKAARQVLSEGTDILKDEPEENGEKLVEFKNKTNSNLLSSVPAIPLLSEVANVNVAVTSDIFEQVKSLLEIEGKVMSQVPVQISEVVPGPGSLTILWAETDEEYELGEFWLQYGQGSYQMFEDNNNLTFHTAYVGSQCSYTVKNLNLSTPYSFRVCARGESDTPWSAWSLPKIASTDIDHLRWAKCESPSYTLGNEERIATRTGDGLTHVLYSNHASYAVGHTLTIKVLDDADKSPGDGFCISPHNIPTDFFSQDDTIFVNLYGNVSVDGQEMKMKLPEVKKGSVLAFQTEKLPNGKVRVSVQHEEKEVTFDWKVNFPESSNSSSLMFAAMGQQTESPEDYLFFAIRFTQEYWKIAVE